MHTDRLLALLLCAAIVGQARAEQPTKPAAEVRVLLIVPLKYVPAATAAQLVTQFYDNNRAVQVTAEEHTNSLLVRGSVKDMDELRALLADQDRPAPVGEKRISIELRDVPWSKVFDWLSRETGLAVVGDARLTGTVSIHTPADRGYTIPEVVDLMNEALLARGEGKKYLLTRREKSFLLLSATDKIDPALIPRLSKDQLAEHGRTEIAFMTLTLESHVADDIAPEVRKLLGPFGQVVTMKPNTLIVLDSVGSLQRIVSLIDEMEANRNK